MIESGKPAVWGMTGDNKVSHKDFFSLYACLVIGLSCLLIACLDYKG